MQSHLASILMLLITMVIWGSTFVVTKGVNDQVPPFTLAFVRVAIGALVLLACALRPAGARRQPFALVGAALGHDDQHGADRCRAVLRGVQLLAGVHVRRRRERWCRAAFPR